MEANGHGARHRRAGKARLTDGETPRFGAELRDNFRLPLTVLLGGGLAVVWGTATALSDDPLWSRFLATLAAVSGVVVLASFLLRFRPAVLATDLWQRSPPRRAVRAVLTHAWWVSVIGALVIWAVLQARTR